MFARRGYAHNRLYSTYIVQRRGLHPPGDAMLFGSLICFFGIDMKNSRSTEAGNLDFIG